MEDKNWVQIKKTSWFINNWKMPMLNESDSILLYKQKINTLVNYITNNMKKKFIYIFNM